MELWRREEFSLSIQWEQPHHCGVAVDGYRVEWRALGGVWDRPGGVSGVAYGKEGKRKKTVDIRKWKQKIRLLKARARVACGRRAGLQRSRATTQMPSQGSQGPCPLSAAAP